MEISGISTAISSSSQFSTAARVERPSVEHDKSVDETRKHHRHHGKGHGGRALGVFRQELRMALKAVVNTVAPEESTDAAANAESVLDEVSA